MSADRQPDGRISPRIRGSGGRTLCAICVGAVIAGAAGLWLATFMAAAPGSAWAPYVAASASVGTIAAGATLLRLLGEQRVFPCRSMCWLTALSAVAVVNAGLVLARASMLDVVLASGRFDARAVTGLSAVVVALAGSMLGAVAAVNAWDARRAERCWEIHVTRPSGAG